ncbi:MAG: 1,2-phenylacetyl-CoA epoxidase subunit PaaC [Acidimicrobiia bacterium]
MNTITTRDPLATYAVRLGDDNVVLGQRLAEYVSYAPELEEDLAMANTGLDHIGVARHLYQFAAQIENDGRSEDDFAMLRSEREFTNAMLVEQPNTDFAFIIARQFLFDAYQVELWAAMKEATDERIAGIAAKAYKEAVYHLRRSRAWVVRLGDGTDESHLRMQAAIDGLWRYTDELFETDEVENSARQLAGTPESSGFRAAWDAIVDSALEEAGLARPEDTYQTSGGRAGIHTEHLGHLLAKMQWMQRSYPGLAW